MITSIHVDGGDVQFIVVTYSVAVTAVTIGGGDIQVQNAGAEDASIDSQVDAFNVRFGPYPSGVNNGDLWNMINDTGLTFAGGVAFAGPFNGTVL